MHSCTLGVRTAHARAQTVCVSVCVSVCVCVRVRACVVVRAGVHFMCTLECTSSVHLK